MAKKLRDLLSWQVDVSNDTEWEETLAKDGLIIIDIYNGWAGPCVVMQGYLKTLRNKLGDSLVVFATAKADDIECLERFRDRCEPQFSLYKNKVLMSRIRGVDQPKLFNAIYRHLEKDTSPDYEDIQSPPPEMEEEERAAEEARRAKQLRAKRIAELKPLLEQGYTIGIILPDVVATENVDSIIEVIVLKEFNVVDKKETTLTDKAARDLYKDLEHEEYFEDLISFMTSAPVVVLLITKDENIVAEWNGLLGPEDAKVAKQLDPECLRALYGTDKVRNGIHGSFDKESAIREAVILFPDIFREGEELEEESSREEKSVKMEAAGEEERKSIAEGEQKDEAKECAGAEEAKPEDEEKGEVQQETEDEATKEETEPTVGAEGEIKPASVASEQGEKIEETEEKAEILPTTEAEQKQKPPEKTEIDEKTDERTEDETEIEQEERTQDAEQVEVEAETKAETEQTAKAEIITMDKGKTHISHSEEIERNAAVDKTNETESKETKDGSDEINETTQDVAIITPSNEAKDDEEYIINQSDMPPEDSLVEEINVAVTEMLDAKNKTTTESAGEQTEEENSPGSMVEVPGLSSDATEEDT